MPEGAGGEAGAAAGGLFWVGMKVTRERARASGENGEPFSRPSPPGTIIPVSPLKRDFGRAPTGRKHSSAPALLGVFARRAEPPVGAARPVHHTRCRVTPLAVLALLSRPLHQNERKRERRRDAAARDEDAGGR